LFAQIEKFITTGFLKVRQLSKSNQIPQRMKKLITTIILALPVLVFAQSTKLEEVFTPNEIAQMKASNSEELKYLEFRANHGFYFQDMSGVKDISGYQDISEINAYVRNNQVEILTAENFSIETFNPILYDFGADDNPKYFRIGDQGKLLLVMADKDCRDLFKRKYRTNLAK